MTKKILFLLVGLLIFSVNFSVCFAADNTINLGNEITKSIDKTSENLDKVVPGNIVTDTKNELYKEKDNMVNELDKGKSEIDKTGEKIDDNVYKDSKDVGEYNTVRTSVTNEGLVDQDTMTTWMWILLVIATSIIVASIWYYVTRMND